MGESIVSVSNEWTAARIDVEIGEVFVVLYAAGLRAKREAVDCGAAGSLDVMRRVKAPWQEMRNERMSERPICECTTIM